MSRIRKNIEYYRIPAEIETDIGSDNTTTDYRVTNQGDVDAGTDLIIQNVADGVDGNDAANVSQLDTKLSLSGGILTDSMEISGSGKGVILESPDTSRWLITVTDAGALSASAL